MKSLFASTWAVCLSVCFALVPSAVFAQSTGTFTVQKDFLDGNAVSDGNTAAVTIDLNCSNGFSDSKPATAVAPAIFTGISPVLATDEQHPILSATTCTATESAPAGYTPDESGCVDQTFAPAGNYVQTGGTASGGCTITNTAVCGDGIKTPAEECDVASACCDQSTCTFELGGDAVECSGALGLCDLAEFCSGTSAECPADGANLTTECNPSTDLCDPAEFCSDASDDCPPDALEPLDTVCNPSLGVCDPAEVCDGISAECPADVLAPAHTECRGDVSECDVAEVCDGSTVDCPVNGFVAGGTVCGVPAPDFACDAPLEVCEGTSAACIANPALPEQPLVACGVIGKGDGCELNICDGEGPSDFKLLFTPDLPNWVSYKLNASNPGQLFYTLVSEPDVLPNANLLLQIPFPFVTQGNKTLHVYSAADAYTVDSCLVIDEDAGSAPYEVEITMDSYWGAPVLPATDCTEPSSIDPPTAPGAYCKHVTGPNPEDYVPACPSDYDPSGAALYNASLALQECWAYVPVALENVGQFAARLHLDYGLKGKWLDTYCPADGNVDRYAPGGAGDYGFNALGIDVDESSTSNYWLSECNIPTCQPYTFAQGVESDQPSDCYTNHGGKGCDDSVCEDIVCTIDSYCCGTAWDNICAGIADAECSGDLVPVDPAESVVESFNEFKKPVGIFGRAYCADDDGDSEVIPVLPLLGDGFAGLTVKLYKSTGGGLLAQATTDEDGMYFLNYKHKGKAVYYNVELWNGGLLLKETSGNNPTPPGNVPLQANGFAEQNFSDGIDCSAASTTGWVAEGWEITKGKFKTIVP